MQSGRYVRYAVAVVSVVFLLRMLGASWSTGFPATFPDSASYLHLAERGPLSPGFWFADRPPTYPALLWFTGRITHVTVVIQAVVYVLAWGWLASVMWRRLGGGAIAAVGIVALIAVAAQARWALWSTLILTESLTISLSVAGAAAWWQLAEEPTRRRMWLAVAITAAWMLLRDANAASLGLCAVVALGVALVLRRRAPTDLRRLSVTALAVLVLVVGYSAAGQLAGDRGTALIHNNVGLRWLPDDQMRSFFVDRGMPLDAALEARSGSDAWADGEAFLRDPDLAEYRSWAAGDGRTAAVTSFVVAAPWWIDRLWTELPWILSTDLPSYDVYDVSDRLPGRLLGGLDPAGTRAMVAVGGLVSVLSIGLAGRRRPAHAWLVVFLVVPAWVDLYLAYVGDAVEVARHLVGPLVRMSIGTIIAVALGATAVADARRDRRRRAAGERVGAS